MRVEPCDATLGAVVGGVALADLDPGEWEEIEAAFHRYAVLVFPGAVLTPDQQVGFARRFGDIEHVVERADSVPISNQGRDGRVRDPDDPLMEIIRGNMEWHTDSSYRPLAAKASMLSAHVVPSAAGETEWADMRAAYDALDPGDRALVDSATACHSLAYSQGRAGFGDRTFRYGFDVGDAPRRPLVKVHPATGRRSLFIGRHAYGVSGLSEEESERLLDRLVEQACRPPRILRHRWRVGDLVVWDNRCVLHRARPWDFAEPRSMLHTRIAGDPATELAGQGAAAV
ncbi:MAG TPA: TauD/TfdA family dioxygenase [Acidimicrobiales bacterium]|nr:TauD/TfdA family dioxygenase [Acidimicrobiales bacterium]